MVNYKKFFTDMDKQALASSEVFSSYARISKQYEAEDKAALEKETEHLKKVISEKIDKNPELKEVLKAAAKKLKENPEAIQKTDKNFVNAINMLDLGE